MKLKKLPKTATRKKKRLGRGYGSGKGGHTVGRGAKGLKARSKVSLTFEGTKIKKSFLKKLPLRRGKDRFKSLNSGPVIVNVRLLNLLPKKSTVDIQALVKKRIVDDKEARRFGVKILGDGELKVPLTVELPCSKGAVKKIEKVGGEVTVKKLEKKKKEPETKNKKVAKPSDKVVPKKKTKRIKKKK
jgi:large subunit ribosomal protein L15